MALKILTRKDVDKVLDALDLQAAVDSQAAVFAAFSGPKKQDAPGIPSLQLPLRHVLTSPEQTMLFMPGRVDSKTAIKIVSVPTSGGDGLPGTTLIMDEISGRVRAVVNARRLTAQRNAAGSVLSYQLLGNGKPTNIVLFGSGAQAEAHARMFLSLYPSITKCTIVNRRPTERAAQLADSLVKAFPKVEVCLGISSENDFNLADTVKDADIICTMTSSTQALFASQDVKPGAHMCMIGSYKKHMREVEDDLVKRAGIVLVDSKEACEAEAGELQNLTEEEMIEIGDVVKDKPKADKIKQAGDVTMFKSVGLGVQDVAIAQVVLDQAEKLGLGSVIEDYD